MIKLEEAKDILIKNAETFGTERINFTASLGRILAEDITSDINIPPFDKSAMDGYACRKADLENILEVLEVIPAGTPPQKTVGKNQCSKIMTGSMVPKGTDTVIMVEYTEKTDENHIRFTNNKTNTNICYLAEDVNKGDMVLKKGHKISSRDIPVLASVGAVNPSVYKQPKIAVITTGSELVEPENTPGISQIRNSNAYSLIAQLREIGIEAKYMGICEDDKESTQKILSKAVEYADIVLFSGAVSMGDFDFVPTVLKEFGADILFHGIEVKPGQKTIFGRNDKKYFIGVPGNPVSAYMQMHILIIPFIYKLMGHNKQDLIIQLPLKEDFKRKKAKRKEFRPVVIKNNQVEFLEYHGSAHINGLTYANAIMEIDINVTEIKKGELTHVRPL